MTKRRVQLIYKVQRWLTGGPTCGSCPHFPDRYPLHYSDLCTALSATILALGTYVLSTVVAKVKGR